MRLLGSPSSGHGFVFDTVRDIVVVIVGILIALWLESWWQGLEDRRVEQDILSNLREEFVRNKTDLASKINLWRASVVELRDLHELFAEVPTAQSIDRVRAINEARKTSETEGGGFFFDPRFGQLTSVINSGQLGLIEDTELRALIADWPALVADMDLERQIALNLFQADAALTPNPLAMWPDSAFTPDYEAFLSDGRRDRLLRSYSTNLGRTISEAEVIMATTEKIIDLIDASLE